MLLPLFLLFTLMPLLELWLLFQLSGVFGFWTTIAVVLLTGMLGATLAKWQGWLTMFRIQTDLRAGKMPAQAMGDGVMILVAGVLLITPGVITDIVGLALLLPPVRIVVRKSLQLWLAKHVKVEMKVPWQTHQQGSPSSDGGHRRRAAVFLKGRSLKARWLMHTSLRTNGEGDSQDQSGPSAGWQPFSWRAASARKRSDELPSRTTVPPTLRVAQE